MALVGQCTAFAERNPDFAADGSVAYRELKREADARGMTVLAYCTAYAPSHGPSASPTPSNKPTAKPTPSNKPTAKPTPSNKPTAKPSPSNKPTDKATSSTRTTQEPTGGAPTARPSKTRTT